MSGTHSSNSQISESDELDDNVVILPIELILHILYLADEKTVLTCQQVCKEWNMLMMNDVWRRKAEIKTGHKFNFDWNLDWKDFYLICSKNLFGRNFIKNPSGEKHLSHWQIIDNDHGSGWAVECPPILAPLLSKEPEFENQQFCFVTSSSGCYKEYVVDLIAEGFSANILDQIRPPIEVISTKHSIPIVKLFD